MRGLTSVKRCRKLAALVFSVALTCSLAVGAERTQSIQSAAAAVATALSYTGSDEILSRNPDAIASLETAVDSTTPFLSDSIIGRTVWKVLLDSVNLLLPSWNQEAVGAGNPKSFTALLDSATGRLLKVFSECPVRDPDLAPEPSAANATTQLRHSGETFIGFPDSIPSITLEQALDAAIGSNPPRAKEIVALLVLKSVDGVVTPVWSNQGRGIPPLDFCTVASRDSVPLRYWNRERTVVDAVTGRTLYIVNTPGIDE